MLGLRITDTWLEKKKIYAGQLFEELVIKNSTSWEASSWETSLY